MPVHERAAVLFLALTLFILNACTAEPPAETASETKTPIETMPSPDTTESIGASTETAASPDSTVSIAGQITSNETNALIPHAFLQARNNKGMIITVLSNQEGEYQLTNLPAGRYSISARGFGYSRSLTEIAEVETTSTLTVDLQLSPDTDLAKQLSGAEWLSLLPDDVETRQFILDCQGCHQLGWPRQAYGGWPTASQWETSIEKMHGFYGPQSDFPIIGPMDIPHTAAWLAQYLTNDALPPQPLPISAGAQGMRLTEYDFPGIGPHDLVLDGNGQVIVTGMFSDDIYSLDPDTGEFTRYNLPANANPRAVEIDAQGDWWIVLGNPHQLARFDPRTEELTTYSIGMYAHSIALDSAGNVWANGHFRANPGKVVRIDAQDGSVQRFDIPDNNASNLTGLPISYDLRIDANDVVWGSDLNWNRIYRLDPQTGEVIHYELPDSTSGPRRFDFDAGGNLWIPEFSGGRLAMFDPNSESFTEWSTPTKNAEPYVVKVDQKRNFIWVGYAAANRVARFDPVAETFIEYPLPTPFALIRHMAIDESTGDVWFSYHHVPTAQEMVARLETGSSVRAYDPPTIE
jgi:virginiamycin B lyase